MCLVLALLACGAPNRPADPTPEPPIVTIFTVGPARSAGSVRASGLVGYKRETPLAFDAAGVILSIDVDIGDNVRVGQRLARLRRTSVGSNAHESALALQNGRAKLARVQVLFDKGFASQATLDDARLGVERAQDTTILLAPAAGLILRRNAEASQSITAGVPVLILGEADSGMVVRASASSREAALVAIGDKAVVRVGDAAARSGTVSRIAPKSDETTGAFEIEVLLADAKGLRSGQVGQAEIQTSAVAADDGGLTIPTLSLLDARADQGAVYVVDGNKIAHRRGIEIGGLAGEDLVVLSGLIAGERIVATGAAYVRDGEPVRVVDRKRSDASSPQS